MDYPEDRLLEVAIGDKFNRNHVIPANDLTRLVRENPGREVYRSFYTYPEERLTHAKKKKTTKEYVGSMSCSDLHFDFDGDGSQIAASGLVTKLMGLGVPEEWIRVYFSGDKGFHIWVPDLFGFKPGRFAWQDVRATIQAFSPGADRSPANRNGLIRAPHSFHQKSGLYKVPLTIEELRTLDWEDVRRLGEAPRLDFPTPPLSLDEVSHVLDDLLVVVKDKEIQATGPIKGRPSAYFGCMQRLWERGPIKGRRHQELMRMITAWKHQGLGSDQCITLGWKWVENTEGAQYYDITEMTTWAFETGANHYSCSTDPIMLENCIGSACPLFKYRDVAVAATSMDTAAAEYIESVLNPVNGGFNLGDIYPDVRYSILPGDIVLLLADTKIGKSTLFLNWACALEDKKVLFITPEMNTTEMFQRTVQIKHGLVVNDRKGVNEVADAARSGRLSDMLEDLSHIKFMTSPPYLEDMNRIIADEAPDVLVIDPLEMIHLKSGSDKETNDLANGLRTIVNTHKVPLLLVHHINKDGQREGGSSKIEAWMSKGFKRVTEQVDHVLMFEGTPDNPERILRRDRGRRPQNLNLRLKGDPDTFRFHLDNPF